MHTHNIYIYIIRILYAYYIHIITPILYAHYTHYSQRTGEKPSEKPATAAASLRSASELRRHRPSLTHCHHHSSKTSERCLSA